MKSLYILAAVMFAGLLMMTVASFKVVSVAKQQQGNSGTAQPGRQTPSLAEQRPDLMPYVMMSYMGLALFIIGGVGALFAAFRAMTHRF